MNPHRLRRPRHDGAALRYLAQWRKYVELTERRARRGEFNPHAGCPCCDELARENGRGQLESLMRNGGRRAHRLSAAVTRLDERFRAATVEKGTDAWQSAPWWERRTVLEP